MKYTSRLKGDITQVLIKTLLEDAGYHIVPLGIEEIIREVKVLTQEKYLSLSLPTSLTKLPDFFIADKDVSKACLLEVKYRNRWNDEVRRKLGQSLKPQVKEWNPLYLMIFLGEPIVKSAEQPTYWMRVARLSYRDGEMVVFNPHSDLVVKWNESSWDDFDRVQDVFKNLREKELWFAQTIAKTKTILKWLKELDAYS